MKLPKTPPFAYEVNLDDPGELEKFLEFEPARGRHLANRLGFIGRFSTRAADGLMNYAHNKRAANLTRARGEIQTALGYEAICDMIYVEDIQPLVACW